jgi:IS5 family transposase
MDNISVSDQLLAIYVFVDDYLKENPLVAEWRRSPNSCPAFTDAEVITIALTQGVFGCQTLKKAYLLVSSSFHDAFPNLCCYKEWLRRLHNLTGLVGHLIWAALLPLKESLYLVDGKPIPVCKTIRHGRVRLLREDGAYFGKGSTGWFFGFKLHALVHISGQIVTAILTPGNWPERKLAQALVEPVKGAILLADLGYRSQELEMSLFNDNQMILIHPETCREKRVLISSVRERVETTFSQLWTHFIDRVFSRSWNGLWNTIKLKLVHHNLCKAGIIPA